MGESTISTKFKFPKCKRLPEGRLQAIHHLVLSPVPRKRKARWPWKPLWRSRGRTASVPKNHWRKRPRRQLFGAWFCWGWKGAGRSGQSHRFSDFRCQDRLRHTETFRVVFSRTLQAGAAAARVAGERKERAAATGPPMGCVQSGCCRCEIHRDVFWNFWGTHEAFREYSGRCLQISARPWSPCSESFWDASGLLFLPKPRGSHQITPILEASTTHFQNFHPVSPGFINPISSWWFWVISFIWGLLRRE